MAEIVKLQYPITVAGEEITELRIRRPKMRDMKSANKVKDDLEKSLKMIVDLAEITPEAADELDPVDFSKAAGVVGNFMAELAE
ncbi:MAG: phage tail assembly protein [Paracoccus sp. (in: a-proteobacteria)]